MLDHFVDTRHYRDNISAVSTFRKNRELGGLFKSIFHYFNWSRVFHTFFWRLRITDFFSINFCESKFILNSLSVLPLMSKGVTGSVFTVFWWWLRIFVFLRLFCIFLYFGPLSRSNNFLIKIVFFYNVSEFLPTAQETRKTQGIRNSPINDGKYILGKLDKFWKLVKFQPRSYVLETCPQLLLLFYLSGQHSRRLVPQLRWHFQMAGSLLE